MINTLLIAVGAFILGGLVVIGISAVLATNIRGRL